MNSIVTPVNTNIDFTAIKAKQQSTWGAGDYGRVGVTLQITGELLCEALDMRAGQRVLDVAAGNGNATLAAARRFCQVTSTDYVPELLEQGRARAAAELQQVEFRVADAEALPFDDGAFDYVISTFGVMFAPDQETCAAELQRVCASGGKIGLVNWTPDSFIGQLFGLIGRFVPPPAGVKSPARWGTEEFVAEQFGSSASSIRSVRRDFVFRYYSPEHWLDVFSTFYGPVLKTFEKLDANHRAELWHEMLALMARFNRTDDGTLVLPSPYLESVITKA